MFRLAIIAREHNQQSSAAQQNVQFLTVNIQIACMWVSYCCRPHARRANDVETKKLVLTRLARGVGPFTLA